MHTLELKIPPLVLLLVFGLAMFAAAAAAPTATIEIAAHRIIATIPALAGVLIAIAGVWAFRRHQTTVNPLAPSLSSSLVRDGVYRVTRNPMYLGFLLILVGWEIFLSNAVAALLLPCFVAYMNRYQIGPEERALESRFGPEYRMYRAIVRRWL